MGGIYNTRERKKEREGERCKGMLPFTVEESSMDAHIFIVEKFYFRDLFN